MNYEMPKMDIAELEIENMISTLTSTIVGGNDNPIDFGNPENEEEW